MFERNTWFYNTKKDEWTPGPDMKRGRQHHTCIMRGKDVFVIGGEASTRNSLEVWNGKSWSYSTTPIGATGLQLISQGTNLYLFSGWVRGNKYDLQMLSNKVWKINHHNVFIEVGNTVIARQRYALFTVPRGFLTNCQGKLNLVKKDFFIIV